MVVTLKHPDAASTHTREAVKADAGLGAEAADEGTLGNDEGLVRIGESQRKFSTTPSQLVSAL